MATTVQGRVITSLSDSPTSRNEPDPRLLEDARGLAESLSELIRVIQFRDRDRICCYDLSPSQWYALKAVLDLGALTVNELAALLFVDKSSASRLANGLVEKGYVSRHRDPDDGRIVRLAATARGRHLADRIVDDLARQYADILADIQPGGRLAINEVLRRLGRAFAAGVDTSGGSCCVVET